VAGRTPPGGEPREQADLGRTPDVASNMPVPSPSFQRRSAPVKINVHLVIGDADGLDPTITDRDVLEKACKQIEPVGLALGRGAILRNGGLRRCLQCQQYLAI
jgi:hypothetical protein